MLKQTKNVGPLDPPITLDEVMEIPCVKLGG